MKSLCFIRSQPVAHNILYHWLMLSTYYTGRLEARLKSGEFLDVEVLKADIDTIILDNTEGGINLEDATDFDDEVGENGEIDIGEIVAQYLSLEIF